MLVIILVLDVIVKFRSFQCSCFPFRLLSFSFPVLYLDPADPRYLDEKEELLGKINSFCML